MTLSALQDRTAHPDAETIDRDQRFGQRSVLFLFAVGLGLTAALKLAEWRVMPSVDLDFDPWGLAALPLAQFLLGSDRRMALLTCLAGEVLGGLLFLYIPALGTFAIPMGLGSVSAAVLSSQILFAPEQRGDALLALAAGSLVVIGQQISQVGQDFTTTEFLTFDQRAYLVDLSLGFNPLTIIIGAVDSLPAALKTGVVQTLLLAYASIMLVMAWVVLMHLRLRSSRWALALAAMLLAGCVGGALYHIFPAVGPKFAFPSFPAMPSPAGLSAAAAPADLALVRNCMPSLHTTWALLIVINTAGLRRLCRWGAAAFAACIIAATLVWGQHYLIDLIVAVPFTVAMQGSAESLLGRQRPGVGCWIGVVCLAAWLFVLVAHVDWLLNYRGITLGASAATLIISLLAYKYGIGCELSTTRTIMDNSRGLAGFGRIAV